MTRRIIRRLLDALLVLWGVSALVFVLLHLAPGDPLTATQSDPRLTPAVRAAWRATFDQGDSWPVQFGHMWSALLRGEFGWSWTQQRPVIDVLIDAVPYTAWLMGIALLVASVGGGAIGVWLALRGHTRGGRAATTILRLLSAVPEVWIALVLLALLAVSVPLFPMQGVCDARRCGELHGLAALVDVLHHTVLPALTLALVSIVPFARLQRSTTIPALRDPLVLAARARGLPRAIVLRRYVVRRTLLPWITMVGLALPTLIGGAVFVERIFGWPGVGTVLLQAISGRDYPLVMVIAMLGGLLTVAGALLTDIAAALLDARERTA